MPQDLTYPNSLWKQTSPYQSPSITLDTDIARDITCDVAVIGAGFTGVRAALELALAGLDVVVLDSADVGWGASGRNGGQVNPMLPVADPLALLKSVGEVYFERLAKVSLGSADDLFALVKKHKITCDARQDGWLRVAHCSAARIASRKVATAWNEFGAEFDFIDQPEVQALTGSPFYQSAIVSKKAGSVQPLSLILGLAQAATQAGARIFKHAKVKQLHRNGNKWTLDVNKNKIQCDWVVVATNGYTDGLIKGLKKNIIPLVSVQMATEPLPDALIGKLFPKGHTMADTRRIIMYSRRVADNRIVFGGIGKKDFGGNIAGFDWLYKDVARVFPQLNDVKWQFQWGGQLAITDDKLPHFYEPHAGLIAGLGYNGRGVAMSLVMGKTLADRVLGADQNSLPFPVSPLKNIAFRGVQVVGSPLAISVMRLQDRIDMIKK